jgi:hypothetical protein
VTVRRGLKEDPDAAQDRHFAAHPEDRGADVVIFEFYDDEGTADDSGAANVVRCSHPRSSTLGRPNFVPFRFARWITPDHRDG